MDPCKGCDRLRKNDGFVARPSDRSRPALPHRHSCARLDRTVVGRHDEVSAETGRRSAHRVRVHSRHTQPDVLHLDAGGVRDEVRFLPDRKNGSRSQSDCRRNRRTGAGARERDRIPDDEVQHRVDGDGRTAAQLRQYDEGAAHAERRAGTERLAQTRHALDGGRVPGTRPSRQRAADAESGDLAARHDRRTARGPRAREPQVRPARHPRRREAIPCETPEPHHVRIRAAARRQRHS